jgi:BatD DUF11 like domain
MIALRGPWLTFTAAALASFSLAGSALAASPPRVTVQASATQVEVGEPFTVELRAMVEQGEPQPANADLNAPRDLNVVGSSETSQVIVNQTNGGASVQIGLRAVWQLVGQRPGRFTIPAPTVQWTSRRLSGTPVTIEVVPASGRPRHRQPSNPFLMPGGPGFGFSFPSPGGSQDDDASSEHAVPELALPTAPDPTIFVTTRVDKKSAVVGQQISFSIYVYRRIRPPQILSNHDAPLTDFLRVQLAKNPGTDQPVYAMVGGTRYVAELVDQMAIFPLHGGDLHTGQVRFTFIGGTLRTPTERASEDQIIHVSEPPRAGRPAGYTLGDVGQFTLTAAVEPRRIDQGGEVAVTLRLAGTGNLPQSLRMPERTGVEWLEPEKKEAIEPQAGVVGGWRTFGYVVRVKESGTIDLGEVTLPYWDPAASRYQVARAVLGKVEVKPTMPALDPVTRQPVDAATPDPFIGLPGARAALGVHVPPRRRLFDGGPMWLLIAAPPLLVGVFSMGAGAARRARARRANVKDSPAALAQGALAEASRAEASGDGKALASALERALHLAIEGATGLKSRGVLVADLPGELAARDLPSALGDEIAGALAACEAVRFDPEPDPSTTRDLAARVRAVVAALGHRKAP